LTRRRESTLDEPPAKTAQGVVAAGAGPAESSTGADDVAEGQRDDTLDWLATQPHLLDDYAGEWVAFDGRTIVAHDPSFLEVMRRVEELGVEHPYLFPVAPQGYFVG
jgi:hypothetical protein